MIFLPKGEYNISCVCPGAATDCIDNMGSDQYSEKAASQLQECVRSLSSTIQEAEELHAKILKKNK